MRNLRDLFLFPPKGLKSFHSKLSIQWDFQDLIMCKILLVQDKGKNEAFKIASIIVRIKKKKKLTITRA